MYYQNFSEYKLLEKQGAFGFNCSKELLERIGKKVITFGYPFDRNREKLEKHIF